MADKKLLILASGSPRRLALLNQAGIEPDQLKPADIDETPEPREHPRALAMRLARTKAEVALRDVTVSGETADTYILTADTVVATGRESLPKAETVEDAEECLQRLSGRSHRVYTAVCVVNPRGGIKPRIVETRVRMKRLSSKEIEAYIASDEWRGKAGGYAIQGLAGAWVVKIIGSYSNVVGLPLFETVQMLSGAGYPVHDRWAAAR